MQSVSEWKAGGHIVTIDGFDIFFVDTESDARETVLLIHGFPTSSWDWHRVWAPLAGRYRLIAPDMPGFGFSAKPAEQKYSIGRQADLIEALMRYRDIDSFHILAHDCGDTVAQELLARHNDGASAAGIRSVCFLNGGLFPETHRPLAVQTLLQSPLGPLVGKLIDRKRFDASMRWIFGPASQPDISELDGFWTLINHNDGRKVLHKLIAYMKERKTNRERWVGALGNAQIPLALINGSADPVSGAHMVARYLAIIGRPASLIELAGIGHYPQIEAPDEVVEGYLAFLDKIQ